MAEPIHANQTAQLGDRRRGRRWGSSETHRRQIRKVLIIATYFAPGLGGGVARYQREVVPRLVPALAAAGCEVEILTLNDGEGLAETPGVSLVRLPVGRDRSYNRILYEHLYGSVRSWKADVLLSLETWLPVLPVWSNKSLVVMHDALVERLWIERDRQREALGLPRLFYWHTTSCRAARRADRIIADSSFAADEISQVHRVPRTKIVPIYCGVDIDRFRPASEPGAIARVRKRYSLPERFCLFVGAATGPKNLRFLLESFLLLNGREPGPLPVLVTSAKPCSPLEAHLLGRLEESGKGSLFHFAGTIEDQDLPTVYSAAHALIFPSLHEGFGLPPVEAMACGLPVLATNRTSVPEIVDDAAIMFDPGNPQSLLDALQKVNHESVREDLIGKGFERAKKFTWDQTVRQLAEEVLT